MQFTRQFDNGLVLVAEQMPWLESAAFSICLPAGCRWDPAGRAGLASLTCEMAQRGAGSRDSREFLESLERLGVEGTSSVSNAHTAFGAAVIADRLDAVLEIYADLVRMPRLPEEELGEAIQSCMQDVLAIEDELATKALHRLRKRHFADPFGRVHIGTRESLESATIEDVRRHVRRHYQPQGTILSVAGKFDWPRIADRVAALFGDWKSGEPSLLVESPPARGYEHLPVDSSQTHVCLAFDAIPYRDPDYYQLRGAIGVLSDGTSSRLFSEVREKRGLCYSVFASCTTLEDRGAVQCYASTTTERAQETMDVLVGELKRLSQGVEVDELARLKSKMKTSLILQQESSASRAGSLVGDWFHLGRLQSIEELGGILDGLSTDTINRYLASHPLGPMTVVTLGERSLEVPDGVS